MSAWSERQIADGVKGRADVDRTVSEDWQHARSLARRIQHPWYRCQSLATVAERAQLKSERTGLLAEAISAAYEQDEPNRIVTAASWPLRALVHVGEAESRQVVERLLRTIVEEPHGLRRLDGLAALLLAVLPSNALRLEVLERFMLTAAESSGWRTERSVAFVASCLSKYDRSKALHILEGRQPNRFLQRAKAEIDRYSSAEPMSASRGS